MNALLQGCIRGQNRRVDFTFLQQQIEERALGSGEGQHGRQGLTKLLNELRAECRQRGSIPRRTCAKGRTELSRQFQAIVIHRSSTDTVLQSLRFIPPNTTKGRSPLQDPLAPKRRVGAEHVQEVHQVQGLLDDGGVEPAGSGRRQDFRC